MPHFRPSHWVSLIATAGMLCASGPGRASPPSSPGQPAAPVAGEPAHFREETGPAFTLEQWKKQYGQRLNLAQWMKRDPFPWQTYFDGNNPICEQNWFFELGPLGVRAAWRDVDRLNDQAWKAAFPKALSDNGLPLANAIEVLEVASGGPADGRLQKGDLIVAIDGQPIRSSQYTFFDRELAMKNARMLEIHAGQLIDAAEGRGRIQLKVLRNAGALPETAVDVPAAADAARSGEIKVEVAGSKAVSLVAEFTGKDNSWCWVNWLAPRLEGPAGTLDLSKIPPVSSGSGCGPARYGTDCVGQPVQIKGQKIPVVGAHANSVVTWIVPDGYTVLHVAAHTPHNAALRCQVKTHAAKPLEQWLPIAEKQTARPGEQLALPLDAKLPENGVLCLAATGPARFDGIRLTNAAGRTLAPADLKTVFNTYGPWPTDGRMAGPFQFEFRLPPGTWTLSGSVRAEHPVAVKCGVFPPLALPSTAASGTRDIAFDIPRLGSFGGRYDPDNEKLKNYSAMLAARLAAQQSPDGSWEWVPGSYAEPAFHSSMAALGLMATGDPAYDDNVRRAAHWMASFDYSLGHGGRSGGWCYPQGVRLLFLSEYYLRTGDQTVVPAIQAMVDMIQRTCLTVDHVAGHKMWTPGYGGGGWIGATGPIALGLAAAHRTPAKVDPRELAGVLNAIQELGLVYGGIPYSRGGPPCRVPLPAKSLPLSKGWSSGTGAAVIATLMGGGGREFAQCSRQRFGQPPWGDEDGGHATHTLTYLWSSFASAVVGPEARRGNMEAFLWRLTLLRDYAGFINNNTNGCEYYGAESVLGKPYMSTGGVLLVLNAHKKNLFMTGWEKYRTPACDMPLTQPMDRRFRQATLNNWNIVEAALPHQGPASLAAGLGKLRAMPENAPGMGDRLFEFLRKDAPRAAADLLATPGMPEPARSWCAEMLLGVRDNGNYFRKTKDAGAGMAEYAFDPQLVPPHSAWAQDKPPPASLWNGTVTLSDPAGQHPEKPLVVKLEPGKLPAAATVLLPAKAYPLVATYDYTLEGVHIRYQRPMNANPATDHECARHFLVRGCVGQAMESYAWRWPVQSTAGGRLELTRRESKPILLRLLDGTTKPFNLDTLRPEQPYELLVGESNLWGEAPVYEVHLLK